MAQLVGKRWPALFYFLADKTARSGIRVGHSGDTIHITRPGTHEAIKIRKSSSVFVPLIAESFEYFHSSAEPTAERLNGEDYQVVDFSAARTHRMRGFNDFPVLCPSLTEPFVTSEQYLDFAQLTPGATVLDLGAYSGLTSIVFSKAVGAGGRVIAVEPDPINFAASQTNFASHARVNGLDNITLFAGAVSGKPGVLHLTSEGTMGSALTSIIGRHRGTTVEVEALTLQGLADRFDLATIDFVKMDIEGAELDAILQSGEFFRRYRPRLIMEPHMVEGTSSAAAVTRFLEGLGYRCQMIKQHGLLSLPLLTATPD